MRRLGFVAGLALVPALAGCSADQPVELPDAETYARGLFDETNAVRVDNDLEPLIWNDCLADEAAGRADAVKDEQTLEHAPLAVTCTDGDLAGENLVRMDASPAQAVEAWMGSPSHEANVLTAAFLEAGVGCVPAKGALACSWVAEGVAAEGGVLG